MIHVPPLGSFDHSLSLFILVALLTRGQERIEVGTITIILTSKNAFRCLSPNPLAALSAWACSPESFCRGGSIKTSLHTLVSRFIGIPNLGTRVVFKLTNESKCCNCIESHRKRISLGGALRWEYPPHQWIKGLSNHSSWWQLRLNWERG